ncbi:hypothetical protein EEZ25_27525 [Micromonospora aurantiaca]|uniref:COG4315 family predicted lipoprotein n=1 Tax=Micromonospora aurantiaca (nom. illeg.) TaxID=47850 RepID=UPI000F3E9B30|nr:hypothetical protein [Micromonospora aurantiaca]RNH98193.1 hypothetical protein EEZ25_27525 [Micromonospora aurantiaca]
MAASAAPSTAATTLKVGPATLGLVHHTFAKVDTGLATVPGGTFDILTVNGRVAYRFEDDDNAPSRVNCQGDCPLTWPPVLVDDDKTTALPGVDAGLMGGVTRPDGHRQLTYNGWPLYWYFQDHTREDAKGEGLGNNWSTIKKDGKPVFKKALPA